MTKPNVLILDDEISICKAMSFILEDDYHVYSCTEPEEALALFARVEFSLAIVDLRIGMHDGIEILKTLKQISPKTSVIMMTAYGSIRSAVEAMKIGAFYYIAKPVDIEELKILAKRAIEQYNLTSRIEWLNEEIGKIYDVHGLIGKSDLIRQVFTLIEKVKDIDSSVFITGESGTGKELVARGIHFSGQRKEKPFYTLNCAAIPANLMESELFGYEKGAFTGAISRKSGIIQMADAGTLFLDEIGEMDIVLQSKLLRVLQEKKVTPIGGHQEKQVDVRIIAATNKNLKKEVEQGRFREDLYYRLNVIPIWLPPLRDRKEDIPLLVQYFMNKINNKMSKQVKDITKEALQLLMSYHFPGNVRELQNIIERSIALSDSDIISIRDLPGDLRVEQNSISDGKLVPVYIGDTVEAAEKKLIVATLSALKGSRRQTSEILGIGERTLRDKLSKYKQQN